MVSLKKVLLALLAFSCFSVAQDVSIIVNDRGISQYQIVYVSDFDFLDVGGSEDLFDIQIIKGSVGELTNAQIEFIFELDNNQVVFAVTNTFNIPGVANTWTITNQQIVNGYRFPENNSQVKVDESNISDESTTIQDEIYQSNQLPVGNYRLFTELNYFNPATGNPETATDQKFFTISNPTLLELVYPGILLGSGFKYELYTENPVFQWNGSSGEYQVVVFKKADEFTSVEDILNSQPVWESERINTLFAQYPSAGTFPLEFGNTYAWLVRSFISTSSGERIVQSEIWQFSLIDPASTNLSDQSMAKQELEFLLRQLLGSRAESIIRELSNYNLKNIRVNGSMLSVQELYQFIEKYRQEEHQISDLILRKSN